jgi:hypothetical protein
VADPGARRAWGRALDRSHCRGLQVSSTTRHFCASQDLS